MTQQFFKTQPTPAHHNLAVRAWQSWLNYGALNRMEAWRWTPLHALRAVMPRIEAADYQVSVPDGVDETFSIGADAHWLQLKDAPFAALNVALLNDTLCLSVPDGFCADELIALNLDQYRRSMQFARVHVAVGKQAKVALWLDTRVSSAAAQCPIVQIDADVGAVCDAVLWFAGATDSAQVGYALVRQQAASAVHINAVLHGGALARLDVQASLFGEAGHFAFGGVQCLDGHEIGDFHVHVRHLAEHCTSQQLVRGALDDEAFGIFDGMIYVAHGAQKTDAKQDSRYILQSVSAKSHSMPRLEIYADDVQCAHGSTVGFLDPEALFYLQSRGISRAEAKRILILSFLHEAVVVEQPSIADAVHEAITALWSGEDTDDD